MCMLSMKLECFLVQFILVKILNVASSSVSEYSCCFIDNSTFTLNLISHI